MEHEDYESVNTFVVAAIRPERKKSSNDNDYDKEEEERLFRLGEKIKKYRRENNLSQKEFANILQIDVAFVSQMERNDCCAGRRSRQKDIYHENAVQKICNFFSA